MELHTLGVDGGYTQDDIVNVARAFTGWTIEPREGSATTFNARQHDDGGEKIVLGQTIKGGGGESDADRVLDILALHPSTARYLATKLVTRFVSDTPPKALVDRAAARFTATRGDLREVVRTIVTSPEFFAADTYRTKVKTPFEFVVSALRETGADVRTALPLARDAARHGHAALPLPAAHRLRRHGNHVGIGRRTRQPHELRGRARQERSAGRAHLESTGRFGHHDRLARVPETVVRSRAFHHERFKREGSSPEVL